MVDRTSGRDEYSVTLTYLGISQIYDNKTQARDRSFCFRLKVSVGTCLTSDLGDSTHRGFNVLIRERFSVF